MSDDLSRWLALREAADSRSRSTGAMDALVASLPPDRPIRCVDLGSGTGSNIRYLAPRLPQPQLWTAIDREPSLLQQAPAMANHRVMELGALDDPALFAGSHLVTA